MEDMINFIEANAEPVKDKNQVILFSCYFGVILES